MADGDDARLMALVSHELRAPAGVLAGYLKLLARETGHASERQQTLVRNALTASDKLHGLLDELRELLRLRAGEPRLERRAVPLQALVADAIAACGASAEAPGVVCGPMPNVVLQVDRPRLAAALAALARVVARPLGRGAIVHLHGTLDGTTRPHVRLIVATHAGAGDTTPGTPLDESRGGLGLALPLAQAVIAAHGGSVAEQTSTAGTPVIVVALATTG